MKIAVHGRAFSPEFDDAIKQILKRIYALDESPMLEFHFKRFLDERMSVTRDWNAFDEAHEIKDVDLLIALSLIHISEPTRPY